jgi:hypothetical protein
MAISRREFLRIIGVALAGLATARCTPPGPNDRSPRARLRECWLRLAELGQDDDAQLLFIERTRADLVADHRAALDALVAADELEAVVADQVQVAFAEAAFHIWRVNAPMTCYIAYPVEAMAREDILGQLEVLREISTEFDPRLVREVEAALAQDLALLDALAAGEGGVDLVEQFEAHELEVGREAVEASCFLVDVITAEAGP